MSTALTNISNRIKELEAKKQSAEGYGGQEYNQRFSYNDSKELQALYAARFQAKNDPNYRAIVSGDKEILGSQLIREYERKQQQDYANSIGNILGVRNYPQESSSNVVSKNFNLLPINTVEGNLSEQSILQNKNVFPSFETKSKGVASGIVYGRNSSGDINRSLKYTSEVRQEIQAPSNSNVFEKGFSNINLLQQNNVETMKDIETKYPAGKIAPGNELLRYYGAAGSSIGLGIIEGITTPFVYPKETVVGLWNSVAHPIKSFNEMKSSYNTNPGRFLRNIGGQTILFKGVEGGGSILRGKFIELSSTNVPATKYLEAKSLFATEKGEISFPTVNSISDSLEKFELGRTDSGTIKIVSASPKPISFLGQSRFIKIGEGSSGLAGKRTLGLYGSYYGGGSPYFFAIQKTEGYSLSLLPKFSNRPTLSIIEGKGINRVPTGILKKGVVSENNWLKNFGNKDYFYITGNSERAFNPSLPGWSTTEAEVIKIPGSKIKSSSKSLFGFDENIIVSGKRIPVREYKSISGTDWMGNFKDMFKQEGSYKSSSEGLYYSQKSNISLSRLYLNSSISSKKYSSKGYFSSSKLSNISSKLSFKPSSNTSSKNSFNVSLGSYSYGKSKSPLSIPSLSYGSYGSKSSSKYNPGQSSITLSPPNYGSSKTNPLGKSTPKSGSASIKKYDPFKYKTKYISSLEANIFGKRSSKKGFNYAQASTGLVIRPILR